MHSIFYTDSISTVFLSAISGGIMYNITDKDYYQVSEFVHYSCLLGGLYFAYEMFIPGTVFLGFHISYHLDKVKTLLDYY